MRSRSDGATAPDIFSRTGPTRRQLLAAFGLGVPLALAGCASGSEGGAAPAPQVAPIETGPVELSIFWWGGDARAKTLSR